MFCVKVQGDQLMISLLILVVIIVAAVMILRLLAPDPVLTRIIYIIIFVIVAIWLIEFLPAILPGPGAHDWHRW